MRIDRNPICWIKNWYNKSLPLRASFWFMVCTFAQKGISVITTPVFTRIMSQEEYGTVSIFLSWQTLLESILTLCVSSCAMQLFVRYESRKRVLSALCSLELAVTSFWVCVCICFLNQISTILGLSRCLCICMVLLIMTNQAIQLWMSYNRYIFEYRAPAIVTLLMTGGAGIIGAVCVICISPTAEGRIVPLTIITCIIGFVLYFRIIAENRVVFDVNIWKIAITFGIPFIFTNLSHFILASSDRLMIDKMCGSKDVAIYSVAYSVGSVISVFTSAVNASFSPYSYQKISEKRYADLSKRTTQVIAVVALMLMGIMLFSREIVLFFGGSRYIECVDIIFPICMGLYFNYVVQIFSRIQEYLLRKLVLMITCASCAVLNIILNYFFIGNFGYKAAAYTTFICYFLFCFIHYLVYRNTVRKEFGGIQIYNIKHLIVISGALFTVGVTVSILNYNILLKYVLVSAFVIGVCFKRKELINYISNIMKNS